MDVDELYAVHVDDVYRYILSLCANKQVAEDITSETFLKAIQSIDKFKGECHIRVWLCQIAKNTYYNFAKRNNFVTDMPADLGSQGSLELRLVDKSQSLEIHQVLHLLDEPYKEIFSLRVFAELSFADIGGIFNKSEGWARVTFHRAKNKIKERLQ